MFVLGSIFLQMCQEEVNKCNIDQTEMCSYEMTTCQVKRWRIVEPLTVSKLNFCVQDTIKPAIIVKVAIVYLAF